MYLIFDLDVPEKVLEVIPQKAIPSSKIPVIVEKEDEEEEFTLDLGEDTVLESPQRTNEEEAHPSKEIAESKKTHDSCI